MDCERVNAAAQFCREHLVDQPVPLKSGLPFERLRHNIDAEVRFAFRPVASMSLVLSALIKHAQVIGRERLAELLDNCIGGSHHDL